MIVNFMYEFHIQNLIQEIKTICKAIKWSFFPMYRDYFKGKMVGIIYFSVIISFAAPKALSVELVSNGINTLFAEPFAASFKVSKDFN